MSETPHTQTVAGLIPFCPSKRYCIHNAIESFYDTSFSMLTFSPYIRTHSIQDVVLFTYYYSGHMCVFLSPPIACMLLKLLQGFRFKHTSLPACLHRHFLVYFMREMPPPGGCSGVNYDITQPVGHIESVSLGRVEKKPTQIVADVYSRMFADVPNMDLFGMLLPMPNHDSMGELFEAITNLRRDCYHQDMKGALDYCLGVIGKWLVTPDNTDGRLMGEKHSQSGSSVDKVEYDHRPQPHQLEGVHRVVDGALGKHPIIAESGLCDERKVHGPP